jgi:hypothetical protein
LCVQPAAARAACSLTTFSDQNGSPGVFIKGDALPQSVYLEDSQTSVLVRIDCNNNGSFTDPGDVSTTIAEEIAVFDIQGGGRDAMEYRVVGGFTGARKSLLVTFGPSPASAGNTFVLSSAAPLLEGTSLIVDLLGGAGPDLFVAQLEGDVSDSMILVRGDLGAGNDTVGFASTGAKSNAALEVDVTLGSGNNEIQDNLAGTLFQSRSLARYSGGELATNRDSATLDDYASIDPGSRREFRVRFLGGNDTFEGRLVQGLSVDGYARYAVALGAGNDVATWQGQPGVDGMGLLEFKTSGGAGNDTLSVDWDGFLGNGVFRHRLQGGDGNDLLAAALQADSGSSNPGLDVRLEAQRGADTVFGTVLDPQNATLRPWRPAVDGGMSSFRTGATESEEDFCFAFGLPADVLGCERVF